jgi:TRAP-type mannitol/chloroaromatic compound transport system permease large subunit
LCRDQTVKCPEFSHEPTPLSRLILTFKYLVPVGIIIFSVLGLIFLGVATPTEAAALGALATLIVNIFMGRFNSRMLKASMKGSLEVTAMVLMIVAASKTFSSVLAFTNATDGMVEVVKDSVHPIGHPVAMQVIVVVLGC